MCLHSATDKLTLLNYDSAFTGLGWKFNPNVFWIYVVLWRKCREWTETLSKLQEKKKKKAKIDKQRKIIRMSQGGKENNNYMSETLLIELF